MDDVNCLSAFNPDSYQSQSIHPTKKSNHYFHAIHFTQIESSIPRFRSLLILRGQSDFCKPLIGVRCRNIDNYLLSASFYPLRINSYSCWKLKMNEDVYIVYQLSKFTIKSSSYHKCKWLIIIHTTE